MNEIVFITPNFAVTAELGPADFAEARRLGFKGILSNRPDGEDGAQMSARQEAVLAWRAGLQFQHVPATKHDLFANDVIEGMETALRTLEGPVLAHCKTGQRSAIVWAAASARNQSADCVLETLSRAGFNFDFLRDDLEQQVHRRRWTGLTSALDCNCDATTEQRASTALSNVVPIKPAA